MPRLLPGDHVKVSRGFFFHHGIVVEPNESLIDLTSFPDSPPFSPSLAHISAASIPVSSAVVSISFVAKWALDLRSVQQALTPTSIGKVGAMVFKELLVNVIPGTREAISKICLALTEKLGMEIGAQLGNTAGIAVGKKLGRALGEDIGEQIGEQFGKYYAHIWGISAGAVFDEVAARIANEVWEKIRANVDFQSGLASMCSSILAAMVDQWKRHGATGYIRLVSWDEFMGDGKITFVERAGDGKTPLARARSKMFRPVEYDVATCNCEQFATWCLSGKSRSSQVSRATTSTNVVGGAGLGVLFGMGAGTATVAGSTTLGSIAVGLGLMSAPFSWPILVGGTVVGGVVGIGASHALNNSSEASTEGGDFPTISAP